MALPNIDDRALRERNLWRWSALAGLTMLALTIGSTLITALQACASPPGVDPVIAFELARVPERVAWLLANPLCRSGQSTALWFDALAFIPAYTLFMVYGAKAAGGRLVKIAMAATLAGAVLDQIEGVTLWRILGAFPGDPSHFAVLIPAVRGKFALLAAALVLIGGTLVRRRGSAVMPGIAMVAGGALSFVSVFDDDRAAFMALGATLAFLALLGWAVFGALRRQKTTIRGGFRVDE